MRTQSAEERLRRAASFNEDAERYDRARPTYPPELYDHLWRMAQLGPSPKVVEVGCGTGQASLSLAERGAHLTCVEFGENMAAVARRRLSAFPSTEVVVSKFEDWDSKGMEYNLVFAAASWHWIQHEVRYLKAESVLHPGGHLAVVHSEHFYPEGFDPLFAPIQDVYMEVTGSKLVVAAQAIPEPDTLDFRDEDQIAEMARTGVFEMVGLVRILWHIDRTADEYIDLLNTYSDHWAHEPNDRQRLLESIHRIIAEGPTGSIRKHYLTTLRLARLKV